MSFALIIKPLAEAESEEAFAWYSQPGIDMGSEFLDELKCPAGKTQAFLWDLTQPGLALRTTPMGKPAYVFPRAVRRQQCALDHRRA